MKKVLIVAYLYPPIFNSGTRRSLEFVNHLPDHGWEPTVLTVADPDAGECDPALLAEVRPGTRIERVPSAPARLTAWLMPLLGKRVDPVRLKAALQWRMATLWRVPDVCAGWVPGAVARACELHREHRFDAIYATGWPWSDFLVARKAGARTGVPYVVDYRDLWKPAEVEWDQATTLQRLLNPRLERQVLRHAAGVIATTASFLRLLPQELLPRHRFAITNGYDDQDFAGIAAEGPPPGEVRIVYTGVWRPGYGPDDLYAAVRLLRQRGSPAAGRLRIACAGFAPGRAAEYGIADCVSERGRVSHAEALAMMCGADALYLPVSKGVYEFASIPGKLFEYLGSGRPVLASAQAGSEVAGVIAQVGGALRLEPGDVEALADSLEALCEGRAAFPPRDAAALAGYTRAGLTGKLAAALDTISQARP
jgi:glycosyltransferase involved in cell wall biosynthesis